MALYYIILYLIALEGESYGPLLRYTFYQTNNHVRIIDKYSRITCGEISVLPSYHFLSIIIKRVVS